MTWRVQFHADFAREADALSEAVRVELIAGIRLLEHLGPSLGRPAVDTLSGSKHANMKELRFRADGGSGRFYKGLIKRADARFDQHLEALK